MLLTLEKRAKEGSGSLSLLEAEEFSIMGSRVLKDMKEKDAERVSGTSSLNTGTAKAATSSSPLSTPPPPVQAVPSEQPVETLKSKRVTDTSDEEGPAYDGTGGLGLAKGTVNTYVIPGMDEMSPEEYQQALQESIIHRQAERKKAGRYGNRSSWDYLNALSGESGVLKKEE